MSNARTFPIGVYGAQLHVASTRKQMATLRRKYELEKPESMGATWLTVDTQAANTPHLIVWVDAAKLDGSSLVEIVTHEATHAAAQILDHIGQAADRHDSEALAYLAGWVAGRVWESVA